MGSISPANPLTLGNGFSPYNSTYNGTSPTSVAVLTETNKGIGTSSSGVKLSPGNLSSTTSATTSWEVIVANGSDPYRTTINSLLNLGINSNVTLTNPLTLNSAGGVKDTGGATQYNNTAIVDLALKIDPNKKKTFEEYASTLFKANDHMKALRYLDKSVGTINFSHEKVSIS